MYQLLNCLPIAPTKLIRKIKTMKKRSLRRSNSTRCSSLSTPGLNTLKKALSTSSIASRPMSDKYGDLVDTNGEVVQLVAFSNLDVTVGASEPAESTAVECTGETVNGEVRTGEAFEAREIVFRANRTRSEDGRSGVASKLVAKKERLIRSTLNDEELNDQILHELHVNSQPVPTSRTTSNQADSCTLAKHPAADDHRTSLNVNHSRPPLESNDVTATDKPLDTAALKAVETTNELNLTERQLIDHPTTDEADTKLIITATRIDQQKADVQLTNQSNTNKLTGARLTQAGEPAASKPAIQQANASSAKLQFASGQSHDTHLDDKRKTKKLLQDTDLRITKILNGVETWIELNKGSNCALGIDLIERTINDERLFIIHEIIEKGIAETDQRLKVGDVVLQVNDIPLKEMSCEEAIEHLNRTSGSVKLLVYRELICVNDAAQSDEHLTNDLNKTNSSIKVNYSTNSTMQENGADDVEQQVIDGKLYEIIQVELQKKNKGLGLCIVSDNGRSPGSYISEILPNSVASVEGRLKKGDHIVSVNGEDVSSASIHTTLAMLKCLQGVITLKVARLMPGRVVSLESFNRNQFIE